ncbi:fumarylacetoacetate hydrolase family protein [Haloarcula marismortui]|uniref:Fumarylacetoacetate hydrolase family protein n=1 Tax=Haloarcula marismortui ATCC 33800 TaxID=662476 RepID=M0K4R2_9EURY|nr:fumarylacetoacetate hydrolase family protein [Haloarcula sinaiiensis]EMA16196.1 fumarylacetoacetate hydrolase family protein [Haloarcula sinaiiensis ATCC 33800]QUJ72891.1 fumarylacetoacetate hydrolase family protein [Haloarcula sinaiiensis ATCC 33800]
MRYYQLRDGNSQRLAVETGDGVYDLTSVKPQLQTLRDLLKSASIADTAPDELSARHLDAAEAVSEQRLEATATDPVTADEVWAAGVTYQISEEARTEESGTPEMYLDVYDAERPEIFFKSTPTRTVGPDEAVGIRADSDWDVPEPELAIVLYEGDIVGYTVGNDMSSRSIEGENPLYLPQAKVYDRCCSVGPAVVTDIEDPHSLALSMSIHRDGDRVYYGETNTSEMKRTCEELVSYYTAHNAVPELSVLLTGTSLVPDDDFTLQEGDQVSINIESIGTLNNSVTVV